MGPAPRQLDFDQIALQSFVHSFVFGDRFCFAFTTVWILLTGARANVTVARPCIFQDYYCHALNALVNTLVGALCESASEYAVNALVKTLKNTLMGTLVNAPLGACRICS